MVVSPSPTLPPIVGDLVRQIDQALSDYSRFDNGCPPQLASAIQYSLLAPGKRLRPLLVLSAAEACGSPPSRAMPAACAVEMVHTYSLIHDDLPAMDDDDLRRGQPSCHAAFGEALAILAGDALLARAFEIMSRDLQPPEVAAACCQELACSSGATALVGGQTDDLLSNPEDGSLEMLESIHRRKTGALLRTSLRLGGLVGSADQDQLQALDKYGCNLGLAFQIVDDLLDKHGSQTTVGKRVGKDSYRGKLTFPGLMGVAASRGRAAELIRGACIAASRFGDRGEVLQAIAKFVLDRNK